MEIKDIFPIIISIISLLFSLYLFISEKLSKMKNRRIYLKKLFSELRKEIRNNLELISKLLNRVTNSKAVYDLIIRNLINELCYNKFETVYYEYDLLIENNIKSTKEIDLNRVRLLMKEVYESIEKLQRDLKIVSDQPLSNAPIIQLRIRLETLDLFNNHLTHQPVIINETAD
jgi:hypothetical protein